MATQSAVKGTMSLRFGRSAAVDLNAAKLTSKILLGVNIGGHILHTAYTASPPLMLNVTQMHHVFLT